MLSLLFDDTWTMLMAHRRASIDTVSRCPLVQHAAMMHWSALCTATNTIKAIEFGKYDLPANQEKTRLRMRQARKLHGKGTAAWASRQDNGAILGSSHILAVTLTFS